jgi:hypothetical protein
MADKEKDSDKEGGGGGGGKSLNEQNMPGLLALTGLNLAVFALLASIEASKLTEWTKAWALLLPAGIGLAMIRVINGQFNSRQKALLVFWKWKHQYPASEAFTVHVPNDERLAGMTDLAAKLGLPVLPGAAGAPAGSDAAANQESVWYGIYRSVESAPAVSQANRNFLFTRDYAAISFIMMVLLGFAGFFVVSPLRTAVLYFVGLVIQYFLVKHAARNYAIELVTNAIAYKATQKMAPAQGHAGKEDVAKKEGAAEAPVNDPAVRPNPA